MNKITQLPNLFIENHPNGYYKLNPSYENAQENLVYNTFFSNKNIEKLQQQLIYYVFILSNKKFLIPKQNALTLKQVMTFFHLNYSYDIPNNVDKQVDRLNKILIEKIAPSIIVELKQYVIYLQTKVIKDNDTGFHSNILPIDLPSFTSNKGKKVMYNNYYTL